MYGSCNQGLQARQVCSCFLCIGVFLLFLAHQQNIGKQVGAEQRAQPFAEYDSRGEDMDDYKEHDKIDDGT